MTGLLTTAGLTDLRRHVSTTMGDTCIHSIRSTSPDGYGQPVESFADGLTYACGLNVTTGREIRRADSTVVVTDGEMRLPLSALGVVTATDRVRVTYRMGEALATPLTYEIEGEPRLGVTCVLADLRRVS